MGIVEESPLVIAGIYRLLIAVLHRGLDGPRTIEAWKGIYESIDAYRAVLSNRIEPYLDRVKDRFDLFDPSFPFYQVADLDESKAVTIAKIAPQLASGARRTLFDHSSDNRPAGASPAQAARWLVGFQLFSLGGLMTPYASRTWVIKDKTSSGSPLSKAAMPIIQGRSLHETLLLNLVRYDLDARVPYQSTGSDLPAWERSTPTKPEERVPDGYLDWLTWQSRSVKLVGSDDGLIRKAVVMNGYTLHGNCHRKDYESMAGFKKSTMPTGDPFPAIGFSSSRVVWRDLNALSHAMENENHEATTFPPRTMEWVAELFDKGAIGVEKFPLMLLGASSDQASFEYWRSESFPFDVKYLRDAETFSKLNNLLSIVERGGNALRSGIYSFVKESIPDIAQKLKTSKKLDKKDNDRVNKRMDALNLEAKFWADMASLFKITLAQLNDVSDADAKDTILQTWEGSVRAHGQRILNQLEQSTRFSAVTLNAAVHATKIFNGRFKNAT
jgi:CRISPR system Cascade subunit CasA